MSKRQLYNLAFLRIKTPEFSDSFVCTNTMETSEAIELSRFLGVLDKWEGQGFVSEIDYALKSQPFEEYNSLDGATLGGGFQIIPPYAIVNEQVQISLTELKSLIEEWIEFAK